MSERPSLWLDPDWQAQAEAWARAELSGRGIAVVGSVDQPHVRPWSTVLRLPTDAGSVWLKACGTGSGYEPALVQQLAHWCPGDVLTPLGVDRRRALMLLPDGGTTLRSVLAGVFDIDRWQQVLVQYAELQRRLANHANGLLALDVPDHRPTAMPSLLETLLSNDSALRTSPTESMSAETRARLRALQPQYERWCLELADSLIPPTLQHDDLHDGNIMVTDDDGYRFFDWGDASIAHPFVSLLVTENSIEHRYSVSRRSSDMQLLRDAYLESWTDVQSREDLNRLVSLARRVGVVSRAASWQRALTDASDGDLVAYDFPVAGWLGELLDPVAA